MVVIINGQIKLVRLPEKENYDFNYWIFGKR